MEELNLELNHTYLLQYGNSNSISSTTILIKTDKAYQVRWNQSHYVSWELKEHMRHNYSIIEDISDFVAEPKEETTLHVETKLVRCHICHGVGTVPDPNSTAGNTTCPLCYGNKMIPEVVEYK